MKTFDKPKKKHHLWTLPNAHFVANLTNALQQMTQMLLTAGANQ